MGHGENNLCSFRGRFKHRLPTRRPLTIPAFRASNLRTSLARHGTSGRFALGALVVCDIFGRLSLGKVLARMSTWGPRDDDLSNIPRPIEGFRLAAPLRRERAP